MVGPADEQLRSNNRADPRLGEQCRPCRMLPDQLEWLGIEFGELRIQEPDPCRDGLQTEHRQALLDRCYGRDLQLLDPGELDQQRTATKLRA